MPHFLKDWATILAEILCQVSRTHEHTAGRDAALMFPAEVKLFWPSIIQLSHCSQTRSLNGLFIEISNSWRMLIKRRRITAMSFSVWCTAHFSESTRWAWKESHTSRLFFLRRLQSHDCHTFSIHSFIPTSSIHPFRWQCMRTLGGKFSFGNFFFCQAHKYDCELWFLVTSCVDQHSFLVFPISHSRFWLMAGQTKQAFCPCCRCGQVCNLASFCSWWRSCGSL